MAAHPVGASIFNRPSDWPGRDMHRHNPAIGMKNLLQLDAQVKTVQKLRLGFADIRESVGPRNFTR